MDWEQARHNMVSQQVRTWEVTDTTVLELMRDTPRENFVPSPYKDLAFTDIQVPLMFGQSMLTPKTEGKMLQGLALQSDETILEVGTGSGYFTALLSQLAHKVHTVELYPELSGLAQHQCQQHGFYNIEYHVGDAANGYADTGLVDVIVLTGSLPFLPKTFQEQLKPGGRIMAIVGDAPSMEVLTVAQDKRNQWVTQSLFETVAPVLQHAIQPERFVF